jgi:hypothetical protein
MNENTSSFERGKFDIIALDLLLELNARQITHNAFQIKFLSERPDFNVEDYFYETDAVYQETRTALIKSLFSRYGDISEITDLLK